MQGWDNEHVIEADIATAAIALLAATLVPIRRAPAGPAILVFCLSTAAWAAASAVAIGSPDLAYLANAMILAAAASAAASAFVATQRLLHPHRRLRPWLIALFAVEPTVMVLVRTTVFRDLTSAEFRATSVFIVHALYCFGLLLAVIFSLNARQRDGSPRVRVFVVACQLLVIAVIALEVAATEVTQLLVVVGAVLAVVVARHPEDWTTATARGDRLLDSIGVFLFVFDHDGRLEDWNANASSLIELVTGSRPHRDMTAATILGCPVPFEDGRPIDLEARGGQLHTVGQIHTVDPTARAEDRSWVVMLRPVRTNLSEGSFPQVSGALAGHDPATQVLGRRSTTDQLRSAVGDLAAAVRVDVYPTNPQARDDEVMFVVARRLELMYPHAQWGRLGTWTFVAVFDPDDAWLAKRRIDIETQTALGLAATVSTTVCAAVHGETPERFVHRVETIRGARSDTGGR